MCNAQELHNTQPQPNVKPRPLDLKSNTLAIKPSHLPLTVQNMQLKILIQLPFLNISSKANHLHRLLESQKFINFIDPFKGVALILWISNGNHSKNCQNRKCYRFRSIYFSLVQICQSDFHQKYHSHYLLNSVADSEQLSSVQFLTTWQLLLDVFRGVLVQMIKIKF